MKGNPDPSENGRSTRWVKGQPSPNPTAKPRGYGAFRKKCRGYTDEALAALHDALSEPGERVPAAKVLLEYGWGKPAKQDPNDKPAKSANVPTPEEAAAAAARLRALRESH